MKNSERRTTRKDTLRAVAYRPSLENLEARWMPGDAVLSGLLAQAVLTTGPGPVNIDSGEGRG